MRWGRTVAIARKEVTQIRRDGRSLAIVIALPVLMTLAFGHALTLDVKGVTVYVLDHDSSPTSRDLLYRFAATQYFTVVHVARGEREVSDALDAGRCTLAIVIPSEFARRIARGGAVPIQAIVDASDGNTATVALGYTRAVVAAWAAEALAIPGAPRAPPPIAVATRTWFNEDLESAAAIVPGVVAIVMSVVGAFLTALTIAREHERGTLEQLLSTPVTPGELLVGKLAPYFVIGLVDTALCDALALGWFHVPFRGAWALLVLASSLYLVVVLALGYLISAVAQSQLAASQIALVATFLPAFLLSGFVFPLDQLPMAIRVVASILPARYFVSLLRSLFLKGSPFSSLLRDFAALATFAVAITALAARALRRRVA